MEKKKRMPIEVVLRRFKMIIKDKEIMAKIAQLDRMQTDFANELTKKPDKLEKDVYERLADLEVKMAKLWDALLTTTETGKTKVTKLGRRFGGSSMLHNL